MRAHFLAAVAADAVGILVLRRGSVAVSPNEGLGLRRANFFAAPAAGAFRRVDKWPGRNVIADEAHR